MDAMPALTNQIPAFKLASLPVTPFDAAVYQMSTGMPAFGVLLPGTDGLGRNHVLVKTPSREYTVGQQKELLKDMGDEQSVSWAAVGHVEAIRACKLEAGAELHVGVCTRQHLGTVLAVTRPCLGSLAPKSKVTYDSSMLWQLKQAELSADAHWSADAAAHLCVSSCPFARSSR
jgi:hypothetical protein